MANISDIIEQFILDQLDQFNELNLSRNELADYFNVAPSQINYVLSTRFTFPRGFVTESRRGGGGYIKLTRLNMTEDDLVDMINNTLSKPIDYNTAEQLLLNMVDRDVIDNKQYKVLCSAVSDRSLASPLKTQDKLRANILRNVLINILKEE